MNGRSPILGRACSKARNAGGHENLLSRQTFEICHNTRIFFANIFAFGLDSVKFMDTLVLLLDLPNLIK